MRRNNKKKGFTIVELVIVIAVIAILAAVMIPTFSGIIEKARESAALQEAQAAYKEIYALDYADGKLDGSEKASATVATDENVKNYDPTATDVSHFEYEADNGYTVTFDGTDWEVEETSTTP